MTQPNRAPDFVVCWRCRQEVANGSYQWVRVSRTREAPVCRKVCETPFARSLAGPGTYRALRPARKHDPIADLHLREPHYRGGKPPPYADTLLDAADQALKNVVWDKQNPQSPHPRWGRIPTVLLVRLAGEVFHVKQWLATHPADRRALEADPPYQEDHDGQDAEPPY